MKNKHKPKKQEMTSEYLFDDLTTLFETAIPGHGKLRAVQAMLDLQNLIDLRIGEAIKGRIKLPTPSKVFTANEVEELLNQRIAQATTNIENTLAKAGADIEKRIRSIVAEELEKLTTPQDEKSQTQPEKTTSTKKDEK